jgi:hypothetical protein
MALDFTIKDILHKIVVKFVHAFLPDAKKPYNLKAVLQSDLDIHGIASKASVYIKKTSRACNRNCSTFALGYKNALVLDTRMHWYWIQECIGIGYKNALVLDTRMHWYGIPICIESGYHFPL